MIGIIKFGLGGFLFFFALDCFFGCCIFQLLIKTHLSQLQFIAAGTKDFPGVTKLAAAASISICASLGCHRIAMTRLLVPQKANKIIVLSSTIYSITYKHMPAIVK